MSGALDWLAVGDLADERGSHGLIGGGAGRLAAHAAALRATVAIVAKVGDDEAGKRIRDALARIDVRTDWLRTARLAATTHWDYRDGPTPERRVDRGADLALRLDELPPRSVQAKLTVASGYSLSVEPARSAVMGALTGAESRGGRSALLLEAELLWWTNARVTRRALEPAIAAAQLVALTATDAQLLFGDVSGRQALRSLGEMGARIVYLTEADGGVLVREGSRVHEIPASAGSARIAPEAGPAAFWVALSHGQPVPKAAAAAFRYAASRRPAAVGRR